MVEIGHFRGGVGFDEGKNVVDDIEIAKSDLKANRMLEIGKGRRFIAAKKKKMESVKTGFGE